MEKETLKINKGDVVHVKLESLRPFKDGENEWDGVKRKWFAYNLTKGSKEFVYFASEAVHKLFQAAKPEGEFILELRNVKNKDGQLRSIWYLDGMNLWQYEDALKDPSSSPAPAQEKEVAVNPDNSRDDSNWRDKIEERLEKLEKEMYSKAVKTDEEIPF
jgi:hypothetical protein